MNLPEAIKRLEDFADTTPTESRTRTEQAGLRVLDELVRLQRRNKAIDSALAAARAEGREEAAKVADRITDVEKSDGRP